MKVSRALETRAAALVCAALRPLPRRAALALGRGVGRILGDLDRRHALIAADNLRQAFPDWTEERVWRTARAVYAHFAAVLFDILWMSSRPLTALRRAFAVEGGEHMRTALARGKGVIIVTAHIGNWESHGVVHGALFGQLGLVARPLDNPGLDARLVAFREMSGNVVIYKRRALAEVLRMLRAGQAVAILVDQNVQAADGIFVNFFGRKASTTTVAAALALKTGCALVPVHSVLQKDGSYRALYEPEIAWIPSGDRVRDIAHLTQAMTARIEDWVRAAPQQWLWIHRRWKTQPS